MLQRRFDPPLKPEKKIDVACGTKLLDTKQAVCLSWIDSVIGVAGLNQSKQQAIERKPTVKMVAPGATNIQGPRQRVLPLSSKSNDSMASDISFGSKLNERSSWVDSVIGEECLNKLRAQDAKKFRHVQNKNSNSPITMEKTIISSKFPCDEQPGQKSACSIKNKSSVLQCKIDEPVVSEYLFMPTEHEKLAAGSGEKSLLELSGDANESKDEDVSDVVHGLSLMSQEVQRDGTIANMKGHRYNIFQSECKIKDEACKLIIDGGSFTTSISSDVVHALSLSTRRLPTPRYMQWMN